MKRGEIWTTAGAGDYASKPRPAVVVQDDSFENTESIAIVLLTSDPLDAPLLRIPIDPNERNGLKTQSRLMIDKVTTVRKSKIGRLIGKLDDEDILRLDRALLVFFGLAASA